MLRWALIFFVISIVSGLMGFTNISAGSAALAKICFCVALVLFLIFLAAGMIIERKFADKLRP